MFYQGDNSDKPEYSRKFERGLDDLAEILRELKHSDLERDNANRLRWNRIDEIIGEFRELNLSVFEKAIKEIAKAKIEDYDHLMSLIRDNSDGLFDIVKRVKDIEEFLVQFKFKEEKSNGE